MFVVVVVFHRRYCIEAKTISEGCSRNTRTSTAKLLQGLQARITKYIGYRHIFMPVMMKLFILTEAFFKYGYHDMVESSMRGKFWLILFIYFKDIIM